MIKSDIGDGCGDMHSLNLDSGDAHYSDDMLEEQSHEHDAHKPQYPPRFKRERFLVTSSSPTPSLPPNSSFKILQPLISYITSDSEAEEESIIHYPTFSPSPSPTKAWAKRSHADLEQSTLVAPPGSPNKKRTKENKTETEETTMDTTARSSEAVADGGETGILRYFHRETKEQREQRIRRESAKSDLCRQKEAEKASLKARHEAASKEAERFGAKMRKRKSRSNKYDRERAAGLRDENMRLKRQKVS